MLDGYLLGSATAYFIIFVATLYAYHVRNHHPERNWGIWRYLSDVRPERDDALKLIAMMMSVNLIVFLINSAYNPRSTSPLHSFALRYPILPPLALGAAILFAIVYYRKRRKQT